MSKAAGDEEPPRWRSVVRMNGKSPRRDWRARSASVTRPASSVFGSIRRWLGLGRFGIEASDGVSLGSSFLTSAAAPLPEARRGADGLQHGCRDAAPNCVGRHQRG